jgi:hypothetical protein
MSNNLTLISKLAAEICAHEILKQVLETLPSETILEISKKLEHITTESLDLGIEKIVLNNLLKRYGSRDIPEVSAN